MPIIPFLLLLLCLISSVLSSELEALMAVKASLDPHNLVLTSWTLEADPCLSFEGVACNEEGSVTNVSLQGRGLSGKVPKEVARLRSLTGLYLHFNALTGEVPREVGSLTRLVELYLDVNDLSGVVPVELGNMSSLQVLQLCYNRLSGSIPTQLGSLKKLSVLALQNNRLTGAIPASLGYLQMLTRLDLSFNGLFGSVPARLANIPTLQALDISNNSLSGVVPPGLKRLNDGFQFKHNLGLCGIGFSGLKVCSDVDPLNLNRPEPFQPNTLRKDIPESANLGSDCGKAQCSHPSKSPKLGLVFGMIGVFATLTVMGLFAFSWYRRQKQKIGSTFDSSDKRLSTDQVKEACRRSASPLVSLEYSNGWDPLGRSRAGNGFSQEVLEGYMFNLEDVERATQCFSEVNLLGKSSFSATYKGTLRDGSTVIVKCIAKTSCKSDESAFLTGLKILTSLKHDNLVRLRGFCCSKGRGECFLVYDYIPNGNLLHYLDVKDSKNVLEWSTRVSIILGIAKGIRFLHAKKGHKLVIVHQSISAEKVLLNGQFKPMLSGSGLHKLLADDIVFSTLKASAAMGYLAPEYTSTGRFTEKSDVYAFGMIVFQILSGKRTITGLARAGAECGRCVDFVDSNLEGEFSEDEATRLGKVALLCTNELPQLRPSMENVVQELTEMVVGV